jgi:hypothetical protein
MPERTQVSSTVTAHMAVSCALIAAAALLLAACGQTGRLYLPERPGEAGEIVTRPTQTPPAEPTPAPNSPQSVDSPPAPDTPAPEVTEPEDGKRKQNGAQSPPPDPPLQN